MGRSDLAEYSAKRSFDATPEPPPTVPASRRGPLLFVVQQHAARRMHYDFRLECDGVLKSWAVPNGPSLDPADKRLAVPTEDHPFDYASFEGVIPPKQYGAGNVIVWDCGVYSPDEGGEFWYHDRDEAQQRIRAALQAGKLSITLRGEKLKGSFALVRTSDRKSWLLLKHKDRFASAEDVTARNRSVLSGLAIGDPTWVPAHRLAAERLAADGPREPLPRTLAPMHAQPAPAPFNRADWVWEPKLDGYRAIAIVEDGQVTLRSRRGGLALAADFPLLCAELARQDVAAIVLDGEIVAFDAQGRPSFNAMQNRSADAERAIYYCFDLLHFAGCNLRGAPYADRRRWLAQCLLPSARVQLVHSTEDGVALHAAAIEAGFEGVIGKRTSSRYEVGRRSGAWVKVKAFDSAEFVIGGYTKGKGSREPLGALLVGIWEHGRLVFASHVGSGLDAESVPVLKARLDALKVRSCPFENRPDLHAPTTWVAPELVAEVRFQGWTDDSRLRAPVFLRLRDDVDPKSVRRSPDAASAVPVESPPAGQEPPPSRQGAPPRHGAPLPRSRRAPGTAGPPATRSRGLGGRDDPQSSLIDDVVAQLRNPKPGFTLAVGPHEIRLTHLDRVYWPAEPALKQPAQTKRDLLRYLAQVSPYMLPHLADRPLTMIRMPDGIDGQRFYQKHWEQRRPAFVDSIVVFSEHKDESHEYLLCNNLPTLLWLAQSGTLEFHVWHSRAKAGPDTSAPTRDYASSLEALERSVLNFPDYVIFDIDPYIYSGKEAAGAEPELNTVAFEKGKEVAFRLRDLLATMSLEPIVKTSGKTGLHVFVPIERTIDFDQARRISELVGRHLMRLHPQDITMEWSVPKRTGKIFMDHNMNVRGKTLNVAYSPRGAAGAPVSMPLAWDELRNAHPLDFRLSNAVGRLSATGDRWRDALTRKQSLHAILGSD
ncbi:MAG TPA: non-homologous end-joining DNA ligase [Burkholderiaceae bacterium]|nr:non-homologous end-joining DNA ligase [Burkholderiaceae bacterium]